MAGKGQHVVPRDGYWAVRRSGSDRATRLFDTQMEAVTAGREIARNQRGVLYIHGANGLIRQRESFAPDVAPSDS